MDVVPPGDYSFYTATSLIVVSSMSTVWRHYSHSITVQLKGTLWDMPPNEFLRH